MAEINCVNMIRLNAFDVSTNQLKRNVQLMKAIHLLRKRLEATSGE